MNDLDFELRNMEELLALEEDEWLKVWAYELTEFWQSLEEAHR